MRRKIAKKTCFRSQLLKRPFLTAIFWSQGFCSHFYISCQIRLKLYTMKHDGPLKLSIKPTSFQNAKKRYFYQVKVKAMTDTSICLSLEVDQIYMDDQLLQSDFDKGRNKEKEEKKKFSDSMPRHFQGKWPRQKGQDRIVKWAFVFYPGISASFWFVSSIFLLFYLRKE